MQPTEKTRHLSRIAPAVLALVALAGLTSCASNEELQDRMDNRTENYSNLQDRRQIRLDARDQRSDDWYERVMR